MFLLNVNMCRFRDRSVLYLSLNRGSGSIKMCWEKKPEENSIWKSQQRHSYFYLWKFITHSHNECVWQFSVCSRLELNKGTCARFQSRMRSGLISKAQVERQQTAIYNIHTFRMLILCILLCSLCGCVCVRQGIADVKRLLWKFSDNWCLKRSSFLTMSPRLLDDN